MDSVVYANLSATVYKIPTDPGSYVQHKAGNTEVSQANAKVIHKEEQRVYDLDENVDAQHLQGSAWALLGVQWYKIRYFYLSYPCQPLFLMAVA